MHSQLLLEQADTSGDGFLDLDEFEQVRRRGRSPASVGGSGCFGTASPHMRTRIIAKTVDDPLPYE